MFEAYFSSFTLTLFQTLSAAFLCFFVLSDSILKSWRSVAWQTFVFACLFSASFSICATMFAEVYFLPMYGVCLLLGWYYLRRITDEDKVWLLFLICMTLSFMYFCASVTFVVYLYMPQYSSGLYVYEDIFAFTLPIALFWIPFAWEMRHLYRKMRRIIIINRWRLCAIPLLFSISLWLQDVFLPDDIIGVIPSCIVKGFIVFCSFLTYSQMISALISTEKAIHEEENLKFLSRQLEMQKARMEDMEVHTEELRRIRHDRRQHVEVLKALLAEENIDKAREYLQDYEDTIRENIQPPLCENFAVDAICQRYMILAKQADIDTSTSIKLSRNPGISSSDLAVVLGNLWENAIAAALDAPVRKFIQLTVAEKDGKILIRMVNSFSGKVACEDDKYLSTKAGRNFSTGIGLSSIKATAEKYGGVAEFSHSGKLFTASVLLCES